MQSCSTASAPPPRLNEQLNAGGDTMCCPHKEGLGWVPRAQAWIGHQLPVARRLFTPEATWLAPILIAGCGLRDGMMLSKLIKFCERRQWHPAQTTQSLSSSEPYSTRLLFGADAASAAGFALDSCVPRVSFAADGEAFLPASATAASALPFSSVLSSSTPSAAALLRLFSPFNSLHGDVSPA
jgi:hypothetical protein